MTTSKSVCWATPHSHNNTIHSVDLHNDLQKHSYNLMCQWSMACCICGSLFFFPIILLFANGAMVRWYDDGTCLSSLFIRVHGEYRPYRQQTKSPLLFSPNTTDSAHGYTHRLSVICCGRNQPTVAAISTIFIFRLSWLPFQLILFPLFGHRARFIWAAVGK